MARPLTTIERQVTELGPLVAFVAAYFWGGLFAATAVTIAATAIALIATYFITGTVTKIAAFTLILLVVFGGMTLYLNDPKYFKIKVTAINAIFAALIFGGLMFKRLFLKDLLGEALEMPDHAWQVLSVRWGLFFVALAIANEVVWRNFTEPAWVLFKFPGLLIVTVLFAVANGRFMLKHIVPPDDPSEKPSANG